MRQKDVFLHSEGDAWFERNRAACAQIAPVGAPSAPPHHHKPGVHSRKKDFRRLSDGHPAYTCYAHRVSAHGGSDFCDDPQEWVAVSTLRKRGGDHA